MTYSQNDRLCRYAQSIASSEVLSSEKIYQKIADGFEDDLLEFDEFPAEYFDFVLALLSEEKFYSKPGLWNFLMVLSTENHKLQAHHYDRLADAISRNYSNYADPDLCLAVCDFIARNYPPNQAKKTLVFLKSIENTKTENLRKFADEGLWILEREIDRSKK